MTGDLTPRQAAERLGATTRSVQRWIATGRLPARRVGGRWRVATDAIDAFAASDAPGTAIRAVFIANRGEIAGRVAATCDRLGIRSVAPPTEDADGVDLLDIDAVVGAAMAAGADAVHPGFGFLAENADFAAAVIDAGLRWIGPPPDAIRVMGDKAAARQLARRVGIPVLPGYDDTDQADAALAAAAERVGFPLLVKPAAGGGGKGMRVVQGGDALPDAIAAARREARLAFDDERLILERYVDGPRHVEIQVLFDDHGNGLHLGERDCSIQRRHQKVLEEAPSPAVDDDLRGQLGRAAVELAAAAGYVSAGTCEFLLDDRGSYWFLEMNTRLQVEHPVTELVTGRDLVADQLRIAAGERLRFGQDDVRLDGHAIEVRLYAEDADAGFLPATGRVEALRWPAGEGIRVDAGIDPGSAIGGRFDPMLAKIVAHGQDRTAALGRLARALDETLVLGLVTNLRFLRWLVRQPAVVDGEARIDTLERIWPPDPGATAIPDAAWAAAASAFAEVTDGAWGGGWRLNGPPSVRLLADDGTERSVAAGAPSTFEAVRAGDAVHVDVGGRSSAFRIAPPPDVDRAAVAARPHPGAVGAAVLVAPMPGTVLAIHAEPGARLDAGDAVVTLEAMKMEHIVRAPLAGSLAELHVATGDQVERGRVLGSIGRDETDPAPSR